MCRVNEVTAAVAKFIEGIYCAALVKSKAATGCTTKFFTDSAMGTRQRRIGLNEVLMLGL